MNKKVVWAVIQLVFILALISGAVKFFDVENPSISDTINFLPAGVCMLLGIIHSVLWELLSNSGFITAIDWVTALLILCIIVGFLFAEFGAEVKSKFAWEFVAATLSFLAGYEAGKVRIKNNLGSSST